MLKCEERLACAETLNIYNQLDAPSKAKVPKEFVDYLKENATYFVPTTIIPQVPLEDQFISKEGVNLIKKMYKYI